MRRSTAISQVLVLLAFYAVPLFAGTSVALPACCRRDGAHHCAMQEHNSGNETAFRSSVHCPYSCFPAIVLTHTDKLFLRPASTATSLPAFREVLLSENAEHAFTQVAGTLDNRGPPSLTL